MKTLIGELLPEITKRAEEGQDRSIQKFKKQDIKVGEILSKDIVCIQCKGNDYLIIPHDLSGDHRQLHFELIANNSSDKRAFQHFYIVATPSFKGFKAVELFDNRARKIMNLPFKLISNNNEDPNNSTNRFKVTSKKVVVDEDGNKNMIIDGTKEGNVHWFINVVLNQYNYPVTIVTNNLP